MSILELIDRIERLTGRRLRISFDVWRVGDQRYYVSDISRFCAATAWQPRTDLDMGLTALCDWFENSTPARAAGSGRLEQGGYAAAEAQS